MILSNIQKFTFLETDAENFKKLVTEIVKYKVLLCPKLGSIYGWWLPETSPNDEMGGWAKLKSIEMNLPQSEPLSLWDKQSAYSCHKDIRKIVEERLNCYLVPMNDVVYSVVQPYVAEGNNFHIYINNYDTFYETNLEKKSDELMVFHKFMDYNGKLYSLETNRVVYDNPEPTVEHWENVESFDWNQTPNLVYSDDESPMKSVIDRLDSALPDSPKTPKTPPCQKNLMDEFDNEAHNIHETMKIIEDEYASDDNGSSCSSDVIAESDQDASSNYEPSDDDTSYSTEYSDDMDNYYDEKRQDLDGKWYTRREFYDYYGNDEAWDNLDTSRYQPERYDENSDGWYTKEEFYRWYGSNFVWKKMKPKTQFMRFRICAIYAWACYLPINLQDKFIKEMLKTY